MILRAMLLLLISHALYAAEATEEALDCPPQTSATTVPDNAREIAYASSMLWKVTHGAQPPNYVFGTIHISDADIINTLSAETHAALEVAHTFVMEAQIDEAGLLAFTTAMYGEAADTLLAETSPAIARRAQTLLTLYGIPESLSQRMHPWAAFMTLSQPPDEDGIPDAPLDLVLMQAAQAQGDAVKGLETLAEQAQVFAGMPLPEQAELLKQTLCGYEQVRAEMQQLREYYLRGDLSALKRISDEYSDMDALAAKVMRRLVADRNALMAERLIPLLAGGGVFVALGALHLPDEDGVLALLAQHGYTITPLP